MSARQCLLSLAALGSFATGCAIHLPNTSDGSGGSSSATTTAVVASSSTGAPTAEQTVGIECTVDTDCGTGGFCISPTGSSYFGGAAPHGYCSRACTGDSDCGDASECLTADGVSSCYLRCTYGSEPLTSPKAASKCNGRSDVACYAINGTGSACLPTCSSNSQCSSGLVCDGSQGNCVHPSKLAGLQPDGDECNTDTDATTRQCVGQCARFIGTSLDRSQDGLGHCTSQCVLGGTNQCGSNGNNACQYPTGTSGWGDVGFCAETASSPTADHDCDEAGGFFAENVGGQSLCVFHDTCANNAACSGSDTCRDIPGLCSDFCLDRAPTYPANANGIACNACNCGGEAPCYLSCFANTCFNSPGCCLPSGSTAACQ